VCVSRVSHGGIIITGAVDVKHYGDEWDCSGEGVSSYLENLTVNRVAFPSRRSTISTSQQANKESEAYNFTCFPARPIDSAHLLSISP